MRSAIILLTTDTGSSETGSPAPTNENEKRGNMRTPVETRATARQSSTPEINHHLTLGNQSQPIDASLETNIGVARALTPIIARPWIISAVIPTILPPPVPTHPMALLTRQRHHRRRLKTVMRLHRTRIPSLPRLVPLRSSNSSRSRTTLPTALPSTVCTPVPGLVTSSRHPSNTSISHRPLGITILRMVPHRTTLPDREMEMTRGARFISATC